MERSDEARSPMTMTLTWLDVFRKLDQWEVVEKLSALNSKTNSVSTNSTGFVHLCSPEVAHLMVNTHGVIRLFHHFHHDADDGLNDGTNALWALMGAGGFAAAMAVDTKQVVERHIGTPFDWPRMLSWNSTSDVLAAINESLTTRAQVSGVSTGATHDAEPASTPPTATRGRPKKGSGTKNRAKPSKPVEASEDDTDDVTVVGFTMKPTVPVPAFIAAAVMDTYATAPEELALLIVNAIKQRASEDPDPSRATIRAEAASYIPRWVLSVAVNSRRTPGPTKRGVAASNAYSKRADDWAKSLHLKYLAVRARSLIRTDDHASTPGRTEDAIRDLSTLLERQAANAATSSPQTSKTGFDSFPPSTKRMVLFVSERDDDRMVRSRPVQSFSDILALSNVAYVQNHIHHFLRNTKGRDAFIPMGFCAAIRTASFMADTPDRPGAFSLFCCGPQTFARAAAIGREASDHASTLVQMQLKTTDTTTGFSEKDIKSMTKLNFTVPKDFHELARLIENMSGVLELLFGANSPLTHMLDEWSRFLTRAVGSTLATLRQLAHADPSAACRLGWFIEKRMQQYLVLCAGVEHEDEINPALLEFRSTRQQLEDGAFVFPACDFLKERLGRGVDQKGDSQPVAAAGSTRAGRRGQPADAVTNPQQDLFPRDANDTWQVFLDHVRSGPIPNMCCRWHLNGKCVKSCFLSASHVALTTEQTTAVRAWIEQCRARMRRPSSDATPPSKKTKLGPSASAYFQPAFVAKPSQWAFDQERSTAEFHNRRHLGRLGPYRDTPPATVPREPTRTNLLVPATSSTPRISRQPATTRHETKSGLERYAPALDSPPTDHSVARTLSPGDAHDAPTSAHVGTPRPIPGKSQSLVPLPTIPLPNVDSPFPRLPEPRLADALATIFYSGQPRTHATEFRFDWTHDAARHNLEVLKRYALDLDAALRAQPFSALTPGSEFRPTELLAPLLSAHPLWPRFQERISEGAEFPLREISDSDRLADVRANLARGNHKSARGHEAKLISMLKDEASRGWQLPLPREAALEIKGCEVAPLGMVAQTSIDEKGNSIEKLRLTHDQSFSPSGVAGRSVNERVDTSQLTEARFGKAFSRLMYHISFLRQLWPDEPIWMTKVDCKSAYRRIHLKAATAMKSCTSIDDLLLVALRMTFGGAPNPSQWSDVSEMITDLANDLVRRDDWDPSVYHSPHQHLLDTEGAVDNDKGLVDKMSAFGKADYFAVNYPPYDDLPRFDCYLDDIFGAFNPRDAEKSAAAIPLALHLVGRPCDPEVEETFPRDDILAIPKFLAEAKPSERKMILGWIVDTRRFIVALPHDKHMSWTQAVDRMLTHRHAFVTTRDLETTLGRFSHAAYVIPYARHFMGRLYKACERSKQAGKARLTKPQLDDLILWKAFLQKASQGISINRLVCRWPTRIVRVDACPQGIGGYCLKSGLAWRYQLPEHLLGRATLNTLEFLAAFVGMIVEFHEGAAWTDEDVLLSQGDSTSAAGWLAKSNFNDDCPLHLTIARAFADFCLTHEIDHYTQWFPGKENKVADMLSRDFALDDAALTDLITKNCSPFVPQNFRIILLRPALISQIGGWLQLLPKTQLLPTQPVPSAIAAGAVTKDSSDESTDSGGSLFSKDSDEKRKQKRSPASPPPFGTDGFAPDNLRKLAMDPCPVPFVPPSTVWLRPSGLTNLRAQSTTPPDDSTPFWLYN